jgi:hypothetical protein
MTADEVTQIETELDIKLPQHYVDFILRFPGLVRSEIDVSHFLYSSADQLIETNIMMGFHSDMKIIKHKLIIGDNGGGGFYLIDLRNPADERVYIFDHEESTALSVDSFEYYETLESYLENISQMFGLQ